MAAGVELALEVEDEVRVGDAFKLGGVIVGAEGGEDFLGRVHKIENVGGVLAGVRTVEAR